MHSCIAEMGEDLAEDSYRQASLACDLETKVLFFVVVIVVLLIFQMITIPASLKESFESSIRNTQW